MVVPDSPRRAALLTLGCARNEVDSEELAGRLAGSGWELVDLDADDGAEPPDVIVVNTCGFVEQAKKDSIDTLLAASDVAKESGAKVVAVGCLAERYGAELAESLPEADAVLGFDAYPDLAERLGDVLGGHAPAPHVPVDRRTLLPISPAQRPAAVADVAVPGHAWVPDLSRVRLSDKPYAPLKLASGCDRRCAFCAIPSFRGSFVSRPPHDVLSEAAWLAGQGVREVVLVSENSTSYGKDLPGGTRALVGLLPALAAVPGLDRVRVSYLQPAELRPDLLTTIATTPGVAPYFDLSFQHSSPAVLRRMRRFGSTAQFLDLCDRIRALAPGGGHPQQRDRRLPRRDRRRRRRAGGVPHRGAARRRRRVRLLGRGRHRGRRLRRQGAGRGGRRPGVADRGPRRRADDPAGRGPGRHRGDGAGRAGRGRRLRVHRPGGAPGARRWTASACSSVGPGWRRATSSAASSPAPKVRTCRSSPREVLPRRAAALAGAGAS